MKFYLNIEAESLSELLAQLNVPNPLVNSLAGSGAHEDAFTTNVEIPEPNIEHFTVNLYRSNTVDFAVGRHVFEDDREAERKATHGHIATVGFDIDTDTGKVMSSLPLNEGPGTRFFALSSFDEPSFSGGYSTRQAARTNNPDAAAIMGICNRASGAYAG